MLALAFVCFGVAAVAVTAVAGPWRRVAASALLFGALALGVQRWGWWVALTLLLAVVSAAASVLVLVLAPTPRLSGKVGGVAAAAGTAAMAVAWLVGLPE